MCLNLGSDTNCMFSVRSTQCVLCEFVRYWCSCVDKAPCLEGICGNWGSAVCILSFGTSWWWVVSLTICPVERAQVLFDYDGWWAFEPFWVFWRRENFLPMLGIESQPVTGHCTKWDIPASRWIYSGFIISVTLIIRAMDKVYFKSAQCIAHEQSSNGPEHLQINVDCICRNTRQSWIWESK